MGKKKQTPTEQMIQAVTEYRTSECPNFPPEFLIGLRGALDAGLSCGQITALLVLSTGVCKVAENMPEEEMIERARQLANVMQSDIVRIGEEREQLKRNREFQKTKKEKELREKLREKLRRAEACTK